MRDLTGRDSNCRILYNICFFIILTGLSRKHKIMISGVSGLILIALIFLIAYLKTLGRVQIEFDIYQNKDLIYLSVFAEPPQFAIWLEEPETGKQQTVFVTHRAGTGDWEGKAEVPPALPYWSEIFKTSNPDDEYSNTDQDLIDAITGATPKEDHFIIRVEVTPGSAWICYIEVNLAGDYNDSFPEFNEETLEYDEYSCGQPALVYKAEISALEGVEISPVLSSQSVINKGVARLEPVSPGVTTAREVFKSIRIKVIKPKTKIIDKL